MKPARDTNDEWDREIEADIKSGKLDVHARKAIAEYRAGETTPLPSEVGISKRPVFKSTL